MARDDPRQPGFARLLERGARAGDQFAHATGVSAAIDQAVEEAIVRAFRSQALRRALERALNETDPHEDIDPEELAWLLRRVLQTEAARAMWGEVLESDLVQMLVERIADAPEVRAAITAQGAGMLGDLGVRLSRITEALDDAVERIVRRSDPESETDQAGLATRALAAAVDLGLLFGLFLIGSLITSSIAAATGSSTLPLWLALGLSGVFALFAVSLFVVFWALLGQTPGMRFVAIRVVHRGGDGLGLGLGRANRRMLALLLALLPAGLGFLWIARDRRRRGWHDRMAGTEVVYLDLRSAPHSGRAGSSGASRAGGRGSTAASA